MVAYPSKASPSDATEARASDAQPEARQVLDPRTRRFSQGMIVALALGAALWVPIIYLLVRR